MSEPAPPPDGPLLLACQELARAMDEFDDAACGALGLGRSDLRALNLLEHGPLGPSELARRLGLTRSAVTALTDRLATAGWVVRTTVSNDRRASAIELTPDTWHDLARVYRPLGEHVQQLDADLTDQQRDTLVGAIARIAEIFDAVRNRLRDAPPPRRAPSG